MREMTGVGLEIRARVAQNRVPRSSQNSVLFTGVKNEEMVEMVLEF